MSFHNKSAKSKYLKRKVKQNLEEIIREEKVKKIIKGSSDHKATCKSSLSESTAAAQAKEICSYSLTELHSSKRPNTTELTDDPVEFYKLIPDYQPDNDSHVSSSEISELTDYSFSSDSECSTPRTEIKKDNLECNNSSLKEKLIDWALQYNIHHNALSHLLKILREENHPNLPLDSRTLLKTIRKSEIISKNDGSEVSYFGLLEGLRQHNLKKLCVEEGKVVLKINIDGLPISKSTGAQFWPILCQILSKQKVSPFLVACYHGKSKPQSIHEFLEPFVKELQTLQIEGFDFFGTHYDLSIHSVICDAPARALIKCIKSHNGFYGCEKCIQKGTSVNRRIAFLESEAEKRTDESFRLKIHEDHHTGTSPLLTLNIGLVSQLPLDYMHLVVLGAMRKLLLYWIRKGDRSVRIGMLNQVSVISDRLALLSQNIPSEFSRKPRSLKDIDRYKATELRQILLYTGPVVFHSILPDETYYHFLLLHVAISILTNEMKACDYEHVTYAEQLLKLFVQDMKKIYKEESIVYNIHNLIHLADDVRRFGCLDNFSCFPFENFLFQLKKTLRTQNLPLAQLCRRVSEKQIRTDMKVIPIIKLCHQHNEGPCLSLRGKQFKEVIYKGCKISTRNMKDSYVQLVNKKIVKVLNIVQTSSGAEDPNFVFIICNSYYNDGDYYSYPCSSQRQGIYKIGRAYNKLMVYSLNFITQKCIVNHQLKVAIALNHKIF